MAIEPPQRKPPLTEASKKPEFDISVALQKKSVGLSHTEIAKHFGLTDAKLRRNVRKAGFGIAWDEIGRLNPDFIYDEYINSRTKRINLETKHGIDPHTFTKLLKVAKAANGSEPLSTSESSILIGNRCIPIIQNVYYPSAHPLKRMTQEQVENLVNSMIAMRREGKPDPEIAKELGIPPKTLGDYITLLGIGGLTGAAKWQSEANKQKRADQVLKRQLKKKMR